MILVLATKRFSVGDDCMSEIEDEEGYYASPSGTEIEHYLKHGYSISMITESLRLSLSLMGFNSQAPQP